MSPNDVKEDDLEPVTPEGTEIPREPGEGIPNKIESTVKTLRGKRKSTIEGGTGAFTIHGNGGNTGTNTYGTGAIPVLSGTIEGIHTFTENEIHVLKANPIGPCSPNQLLETVPNELTTIPACLFNGIDIDNPELTWAIDEKFLCVSCDFSGSTKVLNHMDRSGLKGQFYQLYRAVHTKISDIVHEFGGEIMHYFGDEQFCIIPNIQNIKNSFYKKLQDEVEPMLEKLNRIYRDAGGQASGIGLRVTTQIAKDLNVSLEEVVGVTFSGAMIKKLEQFESIAKKKIIELPPHLRSGLLIFEEGYNGEPSLQGRVVGQSSAKQGRTGYEKQGSVTKRRLLKEVGVLEDEKALTLLEFTKTSMGVAMFIDITDDNEGRKREIRKYISSVIKSYGGVINKAMKNGGLLAIFGAGFENADGTMERAISSAVECKTQLDQETNVEPFKITFGISKVGPINRMTVGNNQRKDITIYGDTVNTGARIMQEASGQQSEVVGIAVEMSDELNDFCNGEIIELKAKGLGAIEVLSVNEIRERSNLKQISRKDISIPLECLDEDVSATLSEAKTTILTAGHNEIAMLNVLTQAEARGFKAFKLEPTPQEKFTDYESFYKFIQALAIASNTEIEIEKLEKEILNGNKKQIKEMTTKFLENAVKKINGFIIHIESETLDPQSMSLLKELNVGNAIFAINTQSQSEDITMSKVLAVQYAKNLISKYFENVDQSNLESIAMKVVSTLSDENENIPIDYIKHYIHSLINSGQIYLDTQNNLKMEEIQNTSEMNFFQKIIRVAGGGLTEIEMGRFENLTLCFSEGVPLDFNSLPSGIVESKEQWEKFTAIMQKFGLIRKIKMKDIYEDDAYYLHPTIAKSTKSVAQLSTNELLGVQLTVIRNLRSKLHKTKPDLPANEQYTLSNTSTEYLKEERRKRASRLFTKSILETYIYKESPNQQSESEAIDIYFTLQYWDYLFNADHMRTDSGKQDYDGVLKFIKWLDEKNYSFSEDQKYILLFIVQQFFLFNQIAARDELKEYEEIISLKNIVNQEIVFEDCESITLKEIFNIENDTHGLLEMKYKVIQGELTETSPEIELLKKHANNLNRLLRMMNANSSDSNVQQMQRAINRACENILKGLIEIYVFLENNDLTNHFYEISNLTSDQGDALAHKGISQFQNSQTPNEQFLFRRSIDRIQALKSRQYFARLIVNTRSDLILFDEKPKNKIDYNRRISAFEELIGPNTFEVMDLLMPELALSNGSMIIEEALDAVYKLSQKYEGIEINYSEKPYPFWEVRTINRLSETFRHASRNFALNGDTNTQALLLFANKLLTELNLKFNGYFEESSYEDKAELHTFIITFNLAEGLLEAMHASINDESKVADLITNFLKAYSRLETLHNNLSAEGKTIGVNIPADMEKLMKAFQHFTLKKNSRSQRPITVDTLGPRQQIETSEPSSNDKDQHTYAF